MSAILLILLAAVAGGILLAATVIAFFLGYHTGWRACDQDRDSLEAHYGAFERGHR